MIFYPDNLNANSINKPRNFTQGEWTRISFIYIFLDRIDICKSYALLVALLISLPAKASENITDTVDKQQQAYVDEKDNFSMQTMFRAGTIAKNISLQKIPLCSVSEEDIWQEIFELVGFHHRSIKTLRIKNGPRALSRCGDNQLAIAHRDSIDIFDLTTFLKIKTLAEPKKWCSDSSRDVYSLAELPDNKLATSRWSKIEIWDTVSGLCLKKWDSGNIISALTISPDNILISGSLNGFIGLWNLDGTCIKTVKAYERPRIPEEYLFQLCQEEDESPLFYWGTKITTLAIDPFDASLLSIVSMTVLSSVKNRLISLKMWNPSNLKLLSEKVISSSQVRQNLSFLSKYVFVTTSKDNNSTIEVVHRKNKLIPIQYLQTCAREGGVLSLASLFKDSFASATTDGNVKIWCPAPDCDYSFKKVSRRSSRKTCFSRCFGRILNCSKFLRSYTAFFKKNN